MTRRILTLTTLVAAAFVATRTNAFLPNRASRVAPAIFPTFKRRESSSGDLLVVMQQEGRQQQRERSGGGRGSYQG
eukprot:CAMPEP_0172534314 /NCGR_PEP_ID=MMETSP1067-20121228/6725_1 /TAXON_ID=265564 ORGANISM="Thalassiosira punctigera, Strain Tpunct2005C2" /NCGR_SAMPLE_ID=MMETSP1067 /ASSEMBLY_ACC=CAM_ASM_000444 /LENGTH=75 /DNA_ID=CAMNT_0013319091 /DNA_START=265 /DNA_END=488 /DNA_ORIENTATION=+